MKRYDVEFYKKIRKSLPQEIVDGVLSYDTTLLLQKIGEEHKLQIDQIGHLIDIVQDIGYGLIASKNFLDTVQTELALDEGSTKVLVADVNEKVFLPVKMSLMRAFGEGNPNKPRTIATIDEHDDEHLSLSKDDILEEIENPLTSISNKVNINVDRVAVVEPILEEKKSIEPEISKKSDAINKARERLLNSISNTKLSSVMTMGGSVSVEPSAEAPIVERYIPPVSTQQKTQIDTTQIKTENKVEIKEVKKIIDPYREAI